MAVQFDSTISKRTYVAYLSILKIDSILLCLSSPLRFCFQPENWINKTRHYVLFFVCYSILFYSIIIYSYTNTTVSQLSWHNQLGCFFFVCFSLIVFSFCLNQIFEGTNLLIQLVSCVLVFIQLLGAQIKIAMDLKIHNLTLT